LDGPIDKTGRTYSHWFKSCVTFSLVIHVIVFKIMIETVNWNWVSTIFGIICFVTYYGMVFIMNFDAIAPMIQPEINGEFNLIVTNIKAIICIIVLPIVALLPDIISLFLKVFWPSPTDAVMLKQKRNPNYVYEGFDEVYVPPLPGQRFRSPKRKP